MIRFVRKYLTYANVIATVAVLFAMSGGAYAATHYLINSTKQINPRVLRSLHGATGSTGSQGSQGKEGPQGKQGSPGAEGKEGKEGPPGKEGATGPQGPEGPSSVVHWKASTNTIGSSSASPNEVELFKIGGVTLWGRCYKNTGNGNTAAATYVSSSQGGTYLQDFVKEHEHEEAWEGREALKKETRYQISEGVAEAAPGKTALLGPNTSGFALIQSGSLSITGFPSQGISVAGAACTFSGYAVEE